MQRPSLNHTTFSNLDFRYQMMDKFSSAYAEYYRRTLPQNIISFLVYFSDNTSCTPVG